MRDEEFDKVPNILFDGVSSIEKIGYPGTLIPLTSDTRAVLCGNDSNNVIIVATRFGHGRCLVFAHNGYPSIFFNVKERNERFVKNCRQWLAHGHHAEFLSIDDADSMHSMSTHGKILVWNGHNAKSDAFMNDLCNFLQRGGGLICGTTAWGWLQTNSGKLLTDFPFARFCDYIGVKVTDNFADCSDPIEFRADLVQFKNVYHVVKDLARDPNNLRDLAIIGSAVKELGDTLPGVPVETLHNIVMSAGDDIIPVNTCPVKNKKSRQQTTGICGIMCGLPGIKAPGVRHFPGDFDRPPHIVTDVHYRVESKASEWYCTGYYVVAGIPIQIDVLDQQGSSGWSARIGCHSDDLGNCDELRRWPCISICKPLSSGRIQMNSAFGGLLFLQSPEGECNSIIVNLRHVVLSPMYDLTDQNRFETWDYKRSHAQGLWADIAGRYIVFNLPSKSVLHLTAPELDRALEFWDSIILAHHDLRGTKPTSRERIVCDEQPSLGYMHSGYPIVTHMDMSDHTAEHFIFNSVHLEKKGAWGLFHEIGHNLQRDWWTFDGTTEVTVNIFTLHAMDKICHLQPWIHSWLQDQIDRTREYINNGSDFNEWKDNPGVALFIYAQLAREYGWESYKEVFRKYEETKPNLDSDEDKMDYWVKMFSQQVGQNLVPLFKFWGFPISQSTIDELTDYPIPEIADDFIEMAPERYTV
ncbi:unnamed protein product [Adineta ricciae]|uniref:Peptidase M60 domain-containing protein n=1 Tax=Adineta ricciae TaxID=249248 RepID=A0A813XB71_ADIRI|nr:unnamed protein product [Adineta ricciae]CAF0864371.1 unnamed protein product [Adineta ricciae]